MHSQKYLRAVTNLILLLAAGFAHATPLLSFKTISYVHAPEDTLTIKSVRLVQGEELAIDSVIEVTGDYTLASVENARLGLSISSREKGGKHVWQDWEIIAIKAGKGTFTLRREIDRHGEIHVSIYPETPPGIASASTTRLVFLTSASLDRKKHAERQCGAATCPD
ncbi:hypothetical protein [Cerasicoccus frondis]|uniref:hypothetical protein n=1 Tax=Cerasicoccus frondis TaxID=490090 RepID=UPI0028526FDA|nr:hypothetical protein [Cerasicoccus frondis]